MLQLLLILWSINLVNWLILRSRLCVLGIIPRCLPGLVGIIFSPLLHADFNHLFFNSIPLFVLGLFILALGSKLAITLTIYLAVTEGLLVWLFARDAIHIGASGVISGYFGFILALAYSNPTVITIVLGFVALYYFGSIIIGLFPSSKKVSWEAHVFGFVPGLIIGLKPELLSTIAAWL